MAAIAAWRRRGVNHPIRSPVLAALDNLWLNVLKADSQPDPFCSIVALWTKSRPFHELDTKPKLAAAEDFTFKSLD